MGGLLGTTLSVNLECVYCPKALLQVLCTGGGTGQGARETAALCSGALCSGTQPWTLSKMPASSTLLSQTFPTWHLGQDDEDTTSRKTVKGHPGHPGQCVATQQSRGCKASLDHSIHLLGLKNIEQEEKLSPWASTGSALWLLGAQDRRWLLSSGTGAPPGWPPLF